MMNNMNNNGMNQMGMMNPMGNGMGFNPMNINDQIAQNIKNIIQPYENKIKELEEIIRQKDFEITVLKQKLNISNNNNMMMNPMMMNMNMNMRNINPMEMNMMNQMNNINQYIKKEIDIYLNLENDEQIYVRCHEDDKASILLQKSNFNKGALSYRYGIINEDLTIKDIVNAYDNNIDITTDVYSITFNTTQGEKTVIPLDGNCPVGIAIIYYCLKFKKRCVSGLKGKKISFLFNAVLLRYEDLTPIKEIFQKISNPRVVVNSIENLIGG